MTSDLRKLIYIDLMTKDNKDLEVKRALKLRVNLKMKSEMKLESKLKSESKSALMKSEKNETREFNSNDESMKCCHKLLINNNE
jgi:hypothetical protein